MDLPHISASSLKTWDTCPLQFYADKVLAVPRSEAHDLTKVGSAVHLAFERSNDVGGVSEALPEACEDSGVVMDDYKGMAGELAETCNAWGWWDGVQDLDLCEAEQEFLLDLGEGVRVKGFIDRLDIKGSCATILDIKTQARKFTVDQLRDNLQADIYNLAARKLFPQIEGPIRVEFWVLRHEIQAVTRTEDDANKTEDFLKERGAELLAWPEDKAPPAHIGSHCRWCNYADECPEWN